jgi:hypothetical protein
MENERKRQEQLRKGQQQGQSFDKQPAESPGQRQGDRSQADDRERSRGSDESDEPTSDVDDLGGEEPDSEAGEDSPVPGQPKRTPM